MSDINQTMASGNTNLPLQSKIFCEGYGDFALQSSDGVIFHLSRFLLAYASPVFEDMFNLAPGNARRMSTTSISMADDAGTDELIPTNSHAVGSEVAVVTREHPVVLTEDATTLDLLFRHVDPKQTPSPLRDNTIRQLLEAARKYQLPSVMGWFENEVMKHTEYPYNPYANLANPTNPTNHKSHGPIPISERSLMSRDPLLVLALASEYDLPRLMQQAILQLVESPTSILEKDVDVGFKLYRHIHVLRQQRIQFYMGCIKEAAALKENGKPIQPAVCSTCSYPRSSWIIEISQAVLNTPKWKVFTESVNNPTRNCQWGCSTWSKQLAISMNKWRTPALEFETLVPLPK